MPLPPQQVRAVLGSKKGKGQEHKGYRPDPLRESYLKPLGRSLPAC